MWIEISSIGYFRTTTIPLWLCAIFIDTQILNLIALCIMKMFVFFYLPVANFHTLIVQTCRFSETADDKVYLAFQSLTAEIKPCCWTIWVGLFVQSYQKGILPFYLWDLTQTSTLKITLKYRVTNLKNFTLICIHIAFMKFPIWTISLLLNDSFYGLYNV